MLFTGLLLLVAAAVISPAAAQSPTRTERSTVWLPPRSARAGEGDIYASVITAAPSSTEFLLACTSLWRSASSCAQFSGVTLTYGNNTMKIGFGSETFDCRRGSSATCSVAAGSQTTLAGAASAAWFTAITIVDGHDKLGSARSSRRASSTSTGPAAATSTASGNGVCKRATGSGRDGVDGGSSSATKPKNGNNDADGGCSAASGGFGGLLSLGMAGAAVAVGAVVTVFL